MTIMSIKAYELVPVIERVKLMSDKAKTQIECLDVCGKNMYIGTSDCFVVHYSIDERTQANGKLLYSTEKQGHKYLVVKKPVAQLRAASALNRIMVLCDNTLSLLNMLNLEPIVTGAKIKSVVCFCINDNPVRTNPFSVEICVALKRKIVQLYTVTEDRMMHLRDVTLPEQAVAVGMDGVTVCAALVSQYCMINTDTSHITDLFPIDDNIQPVIKRISKEEFLLSGPSALGIFATSAGISQRPPMQWSDGLTSVSFVHPYIVALNEEFITIHSILDQQQKQAIPFVNGAFLGDFDGRLFVASSREIYSLVPIPFEKQIQALLADKRVQEALELAKNANKPGMSKERFVKIFKRIQQQAAFIEFGDKNFDEAGQLFKESAVDIKEVISLYPHYLPLSVNFTRSTPPLHEIADINQLSRSEEKTKSAYKAFLKEFLEDIRGTSITHGYKLEVDVALLKLYAESWPEKLPELLSDNPGCDLNDCVTWLERHNRLHSLGLLYQHHGENEKALTVWTKLMDSTEKDPSFPGLDFIVSFLASLSNHELLWKHVDWVLEKDEELGVKIFTERPTNEAQSERLRPETVVDYLHRFPRAVITYLEFLIFQRRLEKEKYHTHLAVLYLEAVIKLMNTNGTKKEELDIARSKLRHMLQMSNLYRVQLILGKAKEKEMHAECAILYGKLEEHDKALRVLVHKLKDFGAAENYCKLNSRGKDAADCKRLYHILLSVYLDPTYERRDTLVAPAMSLLNNAEAEFDNVKVLQLLPENWSVGLLAQFLTKSMRTSLHNSRMTRIECMMARGENLQIKQTFIEMQRDGIFMSEDRACAVCNRAFSDPTFVRYPNGVVTHVHCAKNKYICPVSGKLFSADRR